MKRRPCSQCKLNRAERFFVSARGKVCTDCQRKNRRRLARSSHLDRTYGLSHAEYEQLLEYQGGACAICSGTRKVNLDVDHDHATGTLRGILCKRCNRHLLPAAVNDTGILAAAIHYLQHPPAVELLGERKASK